QWRDAAHALFASDDTPVSVIDDSAGFVGQRMVASIVNVAADIAQQTIASPKDIDLAVSLGLGYPRGGPLSVGDALGAALVLDILRNMYRVTGDSRYRPSMWLLRPGLLCLSLTAKPRCVAGYKSPDQNKMPVHMNGHFYSRSVNRLTLRQLTYWDCCTMYCTAARISASEACDPPRGGMAPLP